MQISQPFYLLLLLSAIVTYGESFIVPQEVPSLLSLVYSNIPPIKKGTDSRFGFGYRLGEHADFQVLVELGPQTETKSIGTGSSKRNVRPGEEWQLLKEKERKEKRKASQSWLQNWSDKMKEPSTESTDEMNVPTQPEMPSEIMEHLQQLYSASPDHNTSPGVLPAAEQPNKAVELPADALAILKGTVKNNKTKDLAAITEDLSDVSFE